MRERSSLPIAGFGRGTGIALMARMDPVIYGAGAVLVAIVVVRRAVRHLHSSVEVEPVSDHWLADQKRTRELSQ